MTQDECTAALNHNVSIEWVDLPNGVLPGPVSRGYPFLLERAEWKA